MRIQRVEAPKCGCGEEMKKIVADSCQRKGEFYCKYCHISIPMTKEQAESVFAQRLLNKRALHKAIKWDKNRRIVIR